VRTGEGEREKLLRDQYMLFLSRTVCLDLRTAVGEVGWRALPLAPSAGQGALPDRDEQRLSRLGRVSCLPVLVYQTSAWNQFAAPFLTLREVPPTENNSFTSENNSFTSGIHSSARRVHFHKNGRTGFVRKIDSDPSKISS